MNTFVTTAQFM